MTVDSARNSPDCCDDSMVQLISDFHDGRYPSGSPEAVRVEEHLANCSKCAEMLDDFRLLSQAVRTLCSAECAPGDTDCYVRCVRKAISRQGLRRRVLVSGLSTGVAAAVGAVVTLAVFVVRAPDESPVHEAHHVVAAVEDPADMRAGSVDVVEVVDVAAPAAEQDFFRRLEEAMRIERTAVARPGVVPVGEASLHATVETAPAPWGTGVVLGVYSDELYRGEGVSVVGVVPGSPAHLAGIMPGDVIVEAGGEPLGAAGAEHLRELVLSAGPGASLALLVARDGTTRRVEAVLARR